MSWKDILKNEDRKAIILKVIKELWGDPSKNVHPDDYDRQGDYYAALWIYDNAEKVADLLSKDEHMMKEWDEELDKRPNANRDALNENIAENLIPSYANRLDELDKWLYEQEEAQNRQENPEDYCPHCKQKKDTAREEFRRDFPEQARYRDFGYEQTW